MTDGPERAPSPAVDRALTILEALVTAETPMTLTALATATHVPLATCASIVQTLEMRGYAARRVVGRSHFWRATLKLNGLAAQLVRRIDLAALGQPFLRRLVDDTGMAAHIGVVEGPLVVYAAKVAAPGMVQFNTYPGKTAPFHITALGRAVAAYLPEERLGQLLDHLTLTAGGAAADAVRVKLTQVRDLGYAVEDEEEDLGIGCIAAPFFDAHEQVIGSIGVTGFVDQVRGNRMERNAGLVVAQADALSKELTAGAQAGAL